MPRLPTPLIALAIATLPLFLACGSESASAVGSIEIPPGPARLVDLLDEATIESPLLDITGAGQVELLADAPRRTIFAEDFEAFDMAKAGWRPSPVVAIEKTERGHAFLLRQTRGGARYGWIVAAEPNTHYVFERLVKSAGPLNADFAVVERKLATRDGDQRFSMNYDAGKALALKLHWPVQAAPDGSWQRGVVSFFSTSSTQSLAIISRATPQRHEHLFRWGRLNPQAEHETRFDDLRLHRIAPTPRQAIALMKASQLAAGGDPALGIARYGQFPPLGDIGAAHSARDDNYSYKHALYAPPATDLRFPFRFGKGKATLRFSACLAKQTARGDAARFEVLVRSGDEEKSLWKSILTANDNDWVWQDTSVDLSSCAGRTVELVLRTRSEAGHPHPMWGNPVVDVPPADDAPQNIILIAVDTLRADRLSSYGYEKGTSPNLDALATDGVRFDQVISNSNWTTPAFASIFTGVVPSRHGVLHYGPATPLPEKLDTLAERLREHGWATQLLAYKTPLYDGGFEQGFDVAFNVPRYQVRGSDNLAEAMRWLESSGDRRNFLFLHFNDPHQPFTQPAPYDSMFGPNPSRHGRKMPINLGLGSDKPRRKVLRRVMRGLYDGEVAYVDNRIGAFLDALKKRGLYEDAVIALVSDHGEQLWERGEFGHAREMLHDEVIRVPLIIKGRRDDCARGKVVQTQVRAFDIMPTLLELAGIAVDDALQAESLTPLLAADAPDAPDRLAISESSAGSLAVRNQRWEYIVWTLPGKAEATEALFDLRADPGEENDVVAEHAATAAKMRVQAMDYLLRYRAGHYAVVIGDGVSYEQTIVGATSASSVFGSAPQQGSGEAVVFKGKQAGALKVVAHLAAAGSVKVGGVEYHAVADFPRYETGDLERLVAGPSPGVHFFVGPPAVAQGQERQSMDLRQLEALKALGYTGNKR